VDVAANAHNRHSANKACWNITVASALASILALVRRYARHAPVLQIRERQRAAEIYDVIQNCLHVRQSGLEVPPSRSDMVKDVATKETTGSQLSSSTSCTREHPNVDRKVVNHVDTSVA
jgi:hypothetical protein